MKWTLAFGMIAVAIFSIYSFRNYVSPQRKSEMIATTPKSFYDLSYQDIHGNSVSMSTYKGKYILCVNVASKCGNTPQYKALQSVSEKYKDKLVIIGFPCNQFLGQEPGSASLPQAPAGPAARCAGLRAGTARHRRACNRPPRRTATRAARSSQGAPGP